MVERFEAFDFEMMGFYQKDLTFWVQFKEKYEDNSELRETARDFIVYNEWSIRKIMEMINEDRARP
jgi:hypothetical protein